MMTTIVGPVAGMLGGLMLLAAMRTVHCPRCRAMMPAFRKPAKMRQILWGGWTCPGCKGEMDRRGRPLS